jgi:hypothetical protein
MWGKLDMIDAGRIARVGLADDKTTTLATNIIGFLQLPKGVVAGEERIASSDAKLASTASLTFSLFLSLKVL